MSLPHTHYPWGPPCSLVLAQRNISDDGSHPVGTASGTDDISIPAGGTGPHPKKKRNVCMFTNAAEGVYIRRHKDNDIHTYIYVHTMERTC